jgi:hypothetical protein
MKNKKVNLHTGYHTLTCKTCNKTQVKVPENIVQATCWKCVMMMGGPIQINVKTASEFPRGWKKIKLLVMNDGTVYENGVENKKLKGKLEPNVDEIKKQQKEKSIQTKKKKEERALKKEAKLIKEYNKKKKIKKKLKENKL